MYSVGYCFPALSLSLSLSLPSIHFPTSLSFSVSISLIFVGQVIVTFLSPLAELPYKRQLHVFGLQFS